MDGFPSGSFLTMYRIVSRCFPNLCRRLAGTGDVALVELVESSMTLS